MSVSSDLALPIVVALTVLAAALRFGTLNVQSIWLDESATMILVHRGFAGMLSHLSQSESAPPLYYIFVWAWTKVVGAGPLGFRSLSAFAGTATVPVMYLAGRRISPRVGVWAAALTATNPAMYYYSQEARAYALLILFSAIAFVLWQRALERPDGKRLALWAGVSVLALLTHYFAAFLFVPEVVILGVRVGWRRVVPATAVVILAGLALVPLAASQRANGQSSWIEGASLISRVAETAKEFLVGLYSPLEIVSAVLAALLAAAAVALLRRVSDAHEQRLARDAAIVAGAGLLLPLILALAHLVDVFDGRNVIAAWLPFALLIAIGLGAPRAGRRGLLVGTALCAVSLAVIASVNVLPAYQRDNWRGAAQALPPAGSRILVSQQNASLPLSIYLRWVRPVTGTEVSGSELVFIALRTRRTGRSPLAAVVPTTPPSGFRLVQYSQTTSYAVSRFLARRPVAISVKLLQRMSEPGVATPQAEAMIQG